MYVIYNHILYINILKYFSFYKIKLLNIKFIYKYFKKILIIIILCYFYKNNNRTLRGNVFEYDVARGSCSLGFMTLKGIKTEDDKEYHIDASESVENDINGLIEVTGILTTNNEENPWFIFGMLKDGSIQVIEWKAI